MLAKSTAIVTILLIGTLTYAAAVDGCPTVFYINGSCCEVKSSDNFKFSLLKVAGVYNITNFCGNCKSVVQGYCDAYSGGGGWLVVQRRKDGSVSFDRGWVEYEEGFGDLNGEFWYGLQPLHCLTSQGQWEMRIDLTLTNGTKTYLHYKQFAIEPANDNYTLLISQYTGIFPIDPFYFNNNYYYRIKNMKFTTKDRDNDRLRVDIRNCALHANNNGWWYNQCAAINLNQEYNGKHKIYDGSSWYGLLFSEMKIRPINCN